MNAFTIRDKLFSIFFVTLGLFLVFGLLTIYELNDIKTQQITARTTASDTRETFLSMNHEQDQFYIAALTATLSSSFYTTGTTDDTVTWQKQASTVTTLIEKLARYYRTYSPKQETTVAELKNLFTSYRATFLAQVKSYHDLGIASTKPMLAAKAALDHTIISIGESNTESVNTKIGGLLTNMQADIVQRTSNVIDLTIALLVIVLVSFTAVGATMTLLVVRSISGPLKKLERTAEKLADGDLDTRAQIVTRDEIGHVASAFNRMADKLQVSYASLEQKVQEIEQERAKLQASVSSLSVGFIMVDKKYTVITMNVAARRMLCHLTNADANHVCTLQDIETELANVIELRTLIQRCIVHKKAVVVREVPLRETFLKLFISPIMRGEKAIGAVLLVDDITEAKAMQRSKDEFFSIASHELRTPLTAIRGNMSMVKTYFPNASKDKDLSAIISDTHDASVRLIEIVNDFLDASRLEQGKMEFKKEPVSIIDLIHSVIKEYEVTGSRKKLYLELSPESENARLPLVLIDINKVKQILINLIGNAIKFTAEGGITISATREGTHVKIKVADTGSGIPIENQHLLFHKFQQAASSILTRDTTKGTGLGLYISRLILQGMGGDIALESSIPGKGSTFSFTLPIVKKHKT